MAIRHKPHRINFHSRKLEFGVDPAGGDRRDGGHRISRHPPQPRERRRTVRSPCGQGRARCHGRTDQGPGLARAVLHSPAGDMSRHRPWAAVGRFPPPTLQKKIEKVFRFAPAFTSFAGSVAICVARRGRRCGAGGGWRIIIGSIHAYQMIQFVTDHLGNADGYTAETRLCGRSGLAGCKHIPAKQFFCFSQPVSFVPCNIQPENIGLNPYKRAIFLYLRTIKYFLAHHWHKN